MPKPGFRGDYSPYFPGSGIDLATFVRKRDPIFPTDQRAAGP
jgi:hypothetical protein